MKIKKAIIPIAGKGTRFLPATKQMAKEIIPILNIPMIHYVVEEAVNSGIEQIIFITAYGKEPVENYFDRNFDLEMFLEKQGKFKELELIQKIGKMVEITTVRQKEQLGLGHAVLMAKRIAHDENFAVLLGDDIILSEKPVTKQLMEISDKKKDASVIGVMQVSKEATSSYGIVDGNRLDDRLLRMSDMIEKPRPDEAPTNLATPGRYILTPEIFDILESIPRGAGGEFQLTDAIQKLCKQKDVYAYEFEGDRFDTGNIEGYLDATVEFALRDPSMKKYTLELLASKLKKYQE